MWAVNCLPLLGRRFLLLAILFLPRTRPTPHPPPHPLSWANPDPSHDPGVFLLRLVWLCRSGESKVDTERRAAREGTLDAEKKCACPASSPPPPDTHTRTPLPLSLHTVVGTVHASRQPCVTPTWCVAFPAPPPACTAVAGGTNRGSHAASGAAPIDLRKVEAEDVTCTC